MIVGKASQNLNQKYKGSTVQVDMEGNIRTSATAPTQTNTITLPSDTKLKDLKIGDIVDGKKITNIEYKEGNIYINRIF